MLISALDIVARVAPCDLARTAPLCAPWLVLACGTAPLGAPWLVLAFGTAGGGGLGLPVAPPALGGGPPLGGPADLDLPSPLGQATDGGLPRPAALGRPLSVAFASNTFSLNEPPGGGPLITAGRAAAAYPPILKA